MIDPAGRSALFAGTCTDPASASAMTAKAAAVIHPEDRRRSKGIVKGSWLQWILRVRLERPVRSYKYGIHSSHATPGGAPGHSDGIGGRPGIGVIPYLDRDPVPARRAGALCAGEP